jgi:hypothetical protein
VSSPARTDLLARLARADEQLVQILQGAAVEPMAAAIAERQRILDRLRAVDASVAPWSERDRTMLETALWVTRQAAERLTALRQAILARLQEVARGRRAVHGYRPGLGAGPRLMDRTV